LQSRTVFDRVDRRMRLVVVSASAGSAVVACEEALGVLAPAWVVDLSFNERLKVHSWVEDVGFGTWVGDKSFLVQFFGDL
jgi:hypothetical protein